MQSYSSQRNTTIADFQQIQVSTTLSKSSKWKVIEKAFPAPQLWTSTPKNHPTRYCIYTGGLIHQETPDTSSFQWAEAPQRFCTPSQRGCRSRLTICQLNQFITNSEAAMLSRSEVRRQIDCHRPVKDFVQLGPKEISRKRTPKDITREGTPHGMKRMDSTICSVNCLLCQPPSSSPYCQDTQESRRRWQSL